MTARVHGCHVLITKAQPRHRTRRKVLQHDVRLSGHFQEQFSPLRVFQVQRNALHALAALQKTGRDVLFVALLRDDPFRSGEGTVSPHGITPPGDFDLDNLGPQPGQRHAQERSGEKHGDGQNPQVRKWLHISNPPILRMPVAGANDVPRDPAEFYHGEPSLRPARSYVQAMLNPDKGRNGRA